MRGNQGVALSQRVCTVAAPTVVRRVVHQGGTYEVEFDIALTQQSVGARRREGATAFFESFAQPVRVGQGVIFTEETGIAVVATLDTM
jgi:hypothetical protein